MSELKDTYLGTLPTLYEEKKDWYKTYTIPKRSGGRRIIEAPADWLKELQTELLHKMLIKKLTYSKNAFGCLPKRNVYMAARPHLGAKIVFKMDLSNCFHHVTEDMIKKELKRSRVPFSPEDIGAICYLCTNSRGVLPQGAPTSALLANVAMTNMYAALRNASKGLKLNFTGYLDDLVFSGERAWRIKDVAAKIITAYGFKVNTKKTTTMRLKKEVLGVCVAPGKDQTRLPKRIRNSLRGVVHRLKLTYNSDTFDPALYDRVMGYLSFGVMIHDSYAKKWHKELLSLRKKE